METTNPPNSRAGVPRRTERSPRLRPPVERPARNRSGEAATPRRETPEAKRAKTPPHSRLPRKTRHADVKRNYTLWLEAGFVLSLLLLIGLFRTPLQPTGEFENVVVEQEMVQMEEIVQTKQEIKPPPPPRPPAPVIVPDDAIVEDLELDLDATLDIGEALESLPPPPSPPEEPKEEVAEDEIFIVVEEMPELIGGLASLQSKLRYPDVARLAGIEGRVFIQFIVDEEGNVVDPVVVRGIGGGSDEEALRVVSEAKFKPGRQRGKAVKVRYMIPIRFKMNTQNQ